MWGGGGGGVTFLNTGSQLYFSFIWSIDLVGWELDGWVGGWGGDAKGERGCCEMMEKMLRCSCSMATT